MLASPQPFEPIPSADFADDNVRHRVLIIRPVVLSFVDRYGGRSYLETDHANVAFARLREAAFNGEEVTYFSHDGLEADHGSLAALNCYLRSARAMGRMKLPFDRLKRTGNHRYSWSDFCKYLGLQFS